MAKGRNSYARKLRKRHPTRRRTSSPSPNFYDPGLNLFMQYLMNRESHPAPKPLAKFNVPYSFMNSDLPPKWAIAQNDAENNDQSGFWTSSPIQWTVDKLSRPLYAVAEGSKDFSEQFTDVIRGGSLSNQLRDVGDMFRAGGAGAWQGFSGKEHTTFGEVLRNTQANPVSAGFGIGVKKATGVNVPGTTPEWWRKHNKTTAAVGLTGDILLDPTTYIGVGLVGKMGTGARIFKDAKSVEAAVTRQNRLVDNLLKTGVMSDEQARKIKDLLTANKFRQGFQKAKGAQAKEGEAADLIRHIANDKGRFAANRVFSDTLTNIQKLPKSSIQDRNYRFMSPKVMAGEAATKAGDEAVELTIKEALDNYRTIVEANYKQTLGIGTRKVRFPILPSKTLEGLQKIAQIKPIEQGLDITQKYLRNSHKIVEDVYRTKVEAMHLGRSTTYMAGRYIDDTFKHVKDGSAIRKMTREDRVAEWMLGLRRDSGQLLVKAPGSNVEQVASDVFSAHVDMLSQRVTGLLGELPYSPAELNRMLPPGLPPIFGKRKMKEIGLELGLINPKTGKVLKGKKAELQKAFQEQDWFRSSLLRVAKDSNIKGMKDGAHSLWIATAAVEHAAARRQLLDNLTASFGFSRELSSVDEAGRILVNDLVKKRGWVEAKGVKELEDVVFNPEVAEGISKMLKTMEDQREWSNFTKFLNRITGPWKFLVTQPNPGYHIRNLMGDAFINWIDGAINPADYRAAARLLGWRFHGMEKFEGFADGSDPLLRMAGDPLKNALKIQNKPLIRNTANLRDAEGQVKKYILDSEIYAGMNKHGIRQNFAVSQFGELESAVNTFETAFSGVTRKMGEPFRRISEWREDYMRMAHFMHLLRSNPSKAKSLDEAMQWAADRVRMTHFDYTDFTKFEQQYLSNVFPFYKWTRKALPLMSRFMFEHPGKVIIPEKITRNLSGAFGYWPTEDDPLPGLDNQLVPDWLKAGGYLPMYNTPGTGNPMFARYPSPFSDILAFQGGDFAAGGRGIADSFISQSNPAIRIPAELMMGHQSMFAGENVPLPGPVEYTANQLPVPFMRQILGATGAFNEGEGNLGPAATNLTGMYSRELTERDMRNELLRQLFEEDLTTEENARIRQILKYRFGVEY